MLVIDNNIYRKYKKDSDLINILMCIVWKVNDNEKVATDVDEIAKITDTTTKKVTNAIGTFVNDGVLDMTQQGNIRLPKVNGRQVSPSYFTRRSKNGKPKKMFGSGDVNTVIELMKQYTGPLDGTQKENRRYAYLLSKRAKKWFNEDYMRYIEAAIAFGAKDDFHSQNLTNVAYLYRNFKKIINSAKSKPKGHVSDF